MARPPAIEPDEIRRWCERVLGSPATEPIFREGYLSVVQGLRLLDGREVVVKIRAAAERLNGCLLTHRRLFAAGFRCPAPLSDLVPIRDGWVATAESYVPGGRPLPDAGRAPRLFAGAFARLIDLAPRPDDVPSLWPPLPWTGWNHDAGSLWPWPDDKDIDLNQVRGPAWVDEAGLRSQRRLRAAVGEPRVGHGDWYAGNLRWSGDDLLVVHDWDSVTVDTEAALVGFAAAVFPTTRAGDESSVVESAAFLEEYQASIGRRFTKDEQEASWAAGTWLRAFDTKKQHAVNQPLLSLTEDEAAERLIRAGV